MSVRTRQNRRSKPGVASVNRPGRTDRKKEHRRLRRAAQLELAMMAEPEDHALPRPVHTSIKADPADKPSPSVGSRRFKVWKTKGWKRRSALRAERAASYQALLKSD